MRALRQALFALAMCGALPLSACDPDNPCDPGYHADHGLCVRDLTAMDAAAADGGDEDSGAGAMYHNDDRDFGRGCAQLSDCGGKAPVCGAPMLPLCTAVNCLQGESKCPPDWTCLDISTWDRPEPSIKSICVKL